MFLKSCFNDCGTGCSTDTQAAIYARADNQLQVNVVPDTASSWAYAGHGCGVWLTGSSGLGKDNAINLVQHWMRVLAVASNLILLTLPR